MGTARTFASIPSLLSSLVAALLAAFAWYPFHFLISSQDFAEICNDCSGLAQICVACMIISLFPCMQTSTEIAFCGAEFVRYKILGHTPI